MGIRSPLSARSASPAASRGAKPPRTVKLAYLSATDVFRDLSPREIDEIDRMTAMSTCRRGKVFYTPGETGEVLFILKRGKVNLYRINPDGKKLITATIEAGTVFGEMSIIAQGMHDTFAEAAEECTLCVMSRSDIEHLILTKPQVGLRFMELMAGRLRGMEARMENVAFKSVPARLAGSLLELAEGTELRVTGVSHQDLAEIVGTYRETVTRVLNEFRAKGYIDLGRMNVVVLQPEALQAIAER
jgi:CRP/FNR family cyclic AMP-dependent transcriptional regulator